jgi:hypothetical protein
VENERVVLSCSYFISFAILFIDLGVCRETVAEKRRLDRDVIRMCASAIAWKSFRVVRRFFRDVGKFVWECSERLGDFPRRWENPCGSVPRGSEFVPRRSEIVQDLAG